MNNAVTDNQTRNLAIKFLQLFSDLLNSILQDFNAKADTTEMQTYIKTIEATANGVVFKDGNGTVKYTLNQSTDTTVTKSDPQLSLSSNSLSININQSSDVTVTRLGDGLISAAFVDGTDCALVTVSDTVITFSATSAGTGNYRINVAGTTEYMAGSDTVSVSVSVTGKLDPDLTLSTYSLTNMDPNSYATITAYFDGDGTLSVQSDTNNYLTYLDKIEGNQLVFFRLRDPSAGACTETYVVTLSETDSYQSDTAVFHYYETSVLPSTPEFPDLPVDDLILDDDP